MKDLLPTSIVKVENPSLSAESIKALPEIMKLYLIHNQSFLTDFKFLGFPFHYWYTAQFLLILFVVLCLIYAVTIDKINKEYNVVEGT
jgi:putative solute:sodium symporter small subunit